MGAIRQRVPRALIVAAIAGATHAAFSFYWAAGGDALLETLGARVVDQFADKRWLLIPVALVKLGFALAPALLHRGHWPARRITRTLCWLGAAVLIGWGGLNTAVGNLVLAGAVHPAGGYDRAGMIGHAWLWDPLFLIWGAALALGLLRTPHPSTMREQH